MQRGRGQPPKETRRKKAKKNARQHTKMTPTQEKKIGLRIGTVALYIGINPKTLSV